MKYYHLDRGHRLHEGMVIQNSKHPIVPLTQQEFDALFPNGISEWGKAVLSMQRYCSPVPKFDWDDLIDSNQLPYSDIYEIEVDSEVLSFDSRLLQSWLAPELMDEKFPCASIITAATLKYGFLYWEGGPAYLCDDRQTQRLEYLLAPPLVVGRKVPADEIHSALHL